MNASDPSGGDQGADSTPLSDDEEAFLDELFEQHLRARATGEVLDVEARLSNRLHLRARALALMDLARQISMAEVPNLIAASVPGIAGFTILEEIGRGGVGVVYRARQESLGRIVALKLLAPSLLASARSRERFAFEAKALGRVRHPHVVTIHAVIAEASVCAYAMEWVDGKTLAQAILQKDPALDISAVARLGTVVGRALAAVHDAGLIHRDVKPSNILVRKDGTPLLSDFSLVHDSDHAVTVSGEFVGTAAYAAPEQLRGEHRAVGPWTDVYALGVTLYAGLTGQTPFGTASTGEMLRRIEKGLATPVAKLNRRVPQDLTTIIGKAMDPEIGRRYPTAGAMADDLDRFLRFEPIRARRIGPLLRLRRLASRNRAAFAAATITALIVLAVATIFVLSWQRRLELPGRFREALRQARASLIDPEINHRFFIALNIPGGEASSVPLPPVGVIDRVLDGYRRALALIPDDEAAVLERGVVAVARVLLAMDRRMPAEADPLRTRCPTTYRVAEEWIAAGRPQPFDLADVDRLSSVDRRQLGLLALICANVPLCVKAWEALDADPAGDDALMAAGLGEAWLVLDRPALAVPRLQRARTEFPECGFLTLDLADALVRTGDLARAEATLAIAKMFPSALNEPARVEADLCAARGLSERARFLYENLVPRPPTAVFHHARFLAAEGDRVGAFDCLGAMYVPMHQVERYRELLLDVLEPVWRTLSFDAQAGVVSEAAVGRHRHVALYAIGAVLRDRGWLETPPGRDRGESTCVSIRDLAVTQEVMRLVASPSWRARPAAARKRAREALAVDWVLAGSFFQVAVSVAVSNETRAASGSTEAECEPLAGPWDRTQIAAGDGVASASSFAGLVVVGDVDRDDCADVLVGDPSAFGGRGSARLISGRSGRVLHVFTGDPDARLGRSLGAAGDLDRDGTPDLMIGRRDQVLICSGMNGAVMRVFRGLTQGDGFGDALASAGDLDGDGTPDVLVGAPGAYVQVLSGRTGELLRSFQGTGGFGCSVDGGHDADGDGVADILIGSSSESRPPLSWRGRASLFSGATGSLLWTETGPISLEWLGTSVAFLGDIDGDGMAEWAASAPEDFRSSSFMGAGHVRVYAGPRGTLLRDIGGVGGCLGGFGRRVCAAGDIDGDGRQDLLVVRDHSTFPNAAGEFEIFSPARDFALIGQGRLATTGPIFGSAVVGNVDVDGDGVVDVLMAVAEPLGFAQAPWTPLSR